MTYSPTKYQLTHLLQDVWYRMGQVKTWVVTGGGTTSTINTAWAGVEEQIFEDDDPALIYGSIVVARDAGGLGGAPEGEIARITDYDSSNYTITHDAVSSAIAVGDLVSTVSPLFPYEDMKRLANLAIRKLGKIDVPDTSLTIVGGQTEYSMPIRQRPKAVNIQRLSEANNNRWEPLTGWSVIPATAGSAWTLVVPDLAQGFSLQIIYEDFHPRMLTFDSDLIEVVAPELACCALLAEAYQWYNNQIGGSNAYMTQRENKALQDLELAKVNFPIYRIDEQVQGLPHWGRRGQYVPLTSDRIY